MKPQRGFALLAMVAALLLTATVMFSIRMVEMATAKSGQKTELAARMQRVQQALIQYATIHSRLPCPADGTALSPTVDSGIASPNSATAICTNNQANGVLPWATLGIDRADSIDPWGRKLSYRVFQGTAGLTRANGLRCDTLLPNAGAVYPDCATLPTALTLIQSAPPNNTDIAFVLVSHGVTGNGARLPQGQQLSPLPAAANTPERNNYSAAGPFYDIAHTDPSVDASAVNHYDDVVLYMTRSSLAQISTAMRNWP